MEEEWQCDSSRPPLNKKGLVEHTRQRYMKTVAPYWVDRKAKSSSSRDVDQERFKCECHYCQRYTGSTSGSSTWKKASPHSSSWDKLTQELSNLTLSSGAIQPPLLQERVQIREKSQRKRLQKSNKTL
ncbi:protein FAM156A/FAM156B-like [Ochotona curzoniae]|uniref:protein FAM156A/FAM156B-like n=1 Tax=Ochotona curzoniae TaxID=130825 RepID=UPI001B35172E|nr:protein FAM156A/FAM156B-like [Ochotona curzoniae]